MVYIGDKFQEVKNETTAQIAKRIRQDIKSAIQAGELPGLTCSVRTPRYGSVSIRITGTTFRVQNPERFNPENERMNGYQMPYRTEEADAAVKHIEEIVNQYKRDDSDTSSDYFNTNLYSSVSFDYGIIAREKLAYERGEDLYGVALPVEVAPVEVAPVEVAPVEVAPVEVAPVEVAPVEVAPHVDEVASAETPPESSTEDEGIVIHHSAQEGTIIKGDTYKYREIIKEFRFKWSRNCQFWYVPSTRGHAQPSRNLVYIAAKLRRAGAVARVELIAATEDEADAAKLAYILDKAEHVRKSAERAEARSTAASDRAHGIMDMIPPGQPILVGHHSERRHRRDLERVSRSMKKWDEERNLARDLSDKAATLKAYAACLTPDALKAQREADNNVAEVAKLLHKSIKRDVPGIKWARQTAKGTGSRPWIHFAAQFADGHTMRVCLYAGRISLERNRGASTRISTQGQSARETYDLIVRQFSAPTA